MLLRVLHRSAFQAPIPSFFSGGVETNSGVQQNVVPNVISEGRDGYGRKGAVSPRVEFGG